MRITLPDGTEITIDKDSPAGRKITTQLYKQATQRLSHEAQNRVHEVMREFQDLSDEDYERKLWEVITEEQSNG